MRLNTAALNPSCIECDACQNVNFSQNFNLPLFTSLLLFEYSWVEIDYVVNYFTKSSLYVVT